MTQKKKDLIRDVTKLFNNLPENKQERAIGIMQGMLLTSEETSNTKSHQHNCAHE